MQSFFHYTIKTANNKRIYKPLHTGPQAHIKLPHPQKTNKFGYLSKIWQGGEQSDWQGRGPC